MAGMKNRLEKLVPDADVGAAGVSVIGKGLSVTGDVRGDGDLRVNGRVEGSIVTEGSVQVGPRGEVEGSIEARDVLAQGRVRGDIHGERLVRLEDGCRVDGDVEGPVVGLEDGGVFNGRIRAGEKSERPAADRRKDPGNSEGSVTESPASTAPDGEARPDDGEESEAEQDAEAAAV